MLTGQALTRFRKHLLEWFAQFQRELPWRRNKDPYRIWLSEIMLQQTRVAAAIPYYERFLVRFPTVEELATAPQSEVLRLWSGLGYYSRARNLQKAAQQLVAVHKSTFPRNLESALELPGIGAYTAAAILSIAYGEKQAVLDGNVARVLARLLALRGDIRAPKHWKQLQRTADALLAGDAPGDWNQAMMELGATVCTPRAPQCLLCPVNEFCGARKQGLADVIPERRKKRDVVRITLAALVLLDRKGHTLLLPPPKSAAKSVKDADIPALLSRLWHFPTVEVGSGTGGKAASANLSQDLSLTTMRSHAEREHLAAGRRSGEYIPLQKVRHAVTYREITLFPFLLRVKKLPGFRNARNMPLSELSALAISNLTRKVARAALAIETGDGEYLER